MDSSLARMGMRELDEGTMKERDNDRVIDEFYYMDLYSLPVESLLQIVLAGCPPLPLRTNNLRANCDLLPDI